jgi:hypothetical protein
MDPKDRSQWFSRNHWRLMTQKKTINRRDANTTESKSSNAKEMAGCSLSEWFNAVFARDH